MAWGRGGWPVSAAGRSCGACRDRRARGRPVGRPPRRRAASRSDRTRSSTSTGATGCPTSSRRSRSSLAAAGAGSSPGARAAPASASLRPLAALLAVLALADVFHDGAHPSPATGWYVIALVVADRRAARDSSGSPRARGRGDARRRRAGSRRLLLRDRARPARPLVRARARRPDRRVPDRRQGGARAPRLVARRARALGRGAPPAPRPDRAYSASFSSTGSIETTCRLKRSSESVRPAATPINCER